MNRHLISSMFAGWLDESCVLAVHLDMRQGRPMAVISDGTSHVALEVQHASGWPCPGYGFDTSPRQAA